MTEPLIEMRDENNRFMFYTTQTELDAGDQVKAILHRDLEAVLESEGMSVSAINRTTE